MGDLDNTLIFYIWGDNGASMEGTITGSFNEMTFLNGVALEADHQLALIEKYGGIEELGGDHTAPHFAAAWAHANNTPFQWGKQMASHLGGARDPMVVAWPSRIRPDTQVRTERHPESMDENARLIAEHLEAAGDLHAAYGWHMRAGAWSRVRDVSAARFSWERARQIADTLPADDANRLAMRIAPRTMLCANAWRVQADSRPLFDELRELCTVAGDKASLAIGVMGMVLEALTRDGFAKPRNGRQNICRSWNQSAMRRSLSPCPLGRSPSGF